MEPEEEVHILGLVVIIGVGNSGNAFGIGGEAFFGNRMVSNSFYDSNIGYVDLSGRGVNSRRNRRIIDCICQFNCWKWSIF